MARTPVRSIDHTPAPQTPQPTLEEAHLPGPPPDPQRLHEATDRLNEVLLRFEAALAGLMLGVSASVVLAEEDDGNWIQYLAFRKEHGSFTLMVDSGQPGTEESFTTTAITSTSRETRLRAVQHLSDLYKKLLVEFDDEVMRVNESIARVEELERALRAKASR